MRPYLVTSGAIRIPSYVVMLYLGLLAGTYAAYFAGRADGLAATPLAAAILTLLVPAVLGARLAFVVGRWHVFRRQLRRILPRNAEGGAVAYGALLTVPVSLPLLAVLGLPYAQFWDAGAVGFLAATIFLRIGCVLNGCCCGRATASRFGWAVRDATGRTVRRLPVQAWEAGWAALILVAATLLAGNTPFSGALFLSTLAAYAGGRFFIDFARDAPRNQAHLTVAQSFSLNFVTLSLIVLAIGWSMH